MLTDRFGDLVKALRLEAALSQEELAHRADLHHTYISLLELGKRFPTITVVEKLAGALGIKMSAIFVRLEKEGEPKPKAKKA